MKDQINDCNDEIKDFLKKMKVTLARIFVTQMPPENRYNKLTQENKKLKNAIIMLSYRSYSVL